MRNERALFARSMGDTVSWPDAQKFQRGMGEVGRKASGRIPVFLRWNDSIRMQSYSLGPRGGWATCMKLLVASSGRGVRSS